MTAKQVVSEILEQLPDDCTLADVAYSLYVRQQVEEGIAEAENGDVVSQADMEAKLEQWITSFRTL